MSLFLPLNIIVQHILLSGILPLAEVLRARRLCKRVKHGIDHSLRYWAVMYQDMYWEFEWPVPQGSVWSQSVFGFLAKLFPLGIVPSLKNIAVTRQVRLVSDHARPEDRTQLTSAAQMDVSSPIKIASAYQKILQVVMQNRDWPTDQVRLLRIIIQLQWVAAACMEALSEQDGESFFQRPEFFQVRGSYSFNAFQNMWKQYPQVWTDASKTYLAETGNPCLYLAWEPDGTLAPLVVVIRRHSSGLFIVDPDASTPNMRSTLSWKIHQEGFSSFIAVYDSAAESCIARLELEVPYWNYDAGDDDDDNAPFYRAAMLPRVNVPIHFIGESRYGVWYYRYDPTTGCTNLYPYFAHRGE